MIFLNMSNLASYNWLDSVRNKFSSLFEDSMASGKWRGAVERLDWLENAWVQPGPTRIRSQSWTSFIEKPPNLLQFRAPGEQPVMNSSGNFAMIIPDGRANPAPYQVWSTTKYAHRGSIIAGNERRKLLKSVHKVTDCLAQGVLSAWGTVEDGANFLERSNLDGRCLGLIFKYLSESHREIPLALWAFFIFEIQHIFFSQIRAQSFFFAARLPHPLFGGPPPTQTWMQCTILWNF